MGDFESGMAAVWAGGGRGKWWKGVFGEQGLVAPDMDDVYEGLKNTKGIPRGAQPDGDAESEEAED
eukprot:8390031-Lingulodinium_polyedra.AAC.1